MKKKKILNGTEIGSKTEPATKCPSAPDGAATGFVELDDDSLASVSGGRYLSGLYSLGRKGFPWLVVGGGSGPFLLYFDSAFAADCAADALNDLSGQDVSAHKIMEYLNTSGLRPTNTDEFIKAWDG